MPRALVHERDLLASSSDAFYCCANPIGPMWAAQEELHRTGASTLTLLRVITHLIRRKENSAGPSRRAQPCAGCMQESGEDDIGQTFHKRCKLLSSDRRHRQREKPGRASERRQGLFWNARLVEWGSNAGKTRVVSPTVPVTPSQTTLQGGRHASPKLLILSCPH